MKRSFNVYHRLLTPVDAAGISVALIFTLILMFGVLLPMNARNRQQSAARQTVVREKQRHAGLVTTSRTLQQEVENTRRQIAAAPMKISSAGALNQRLADLALLSNECTLRVEDLKPGDAIQTTHFQIIPVRLSGHGSYQSCAKFIHSLHQQLPDVDVKSFKLSGTPDDPSIQGAFEFQLGWFASLQGTTSQTDHTSTASVSQ